MVKIYHSTDFEIMPWKNKLGSTTQFVIEPPQAQFPADAFAWRFSSAPILSDGEFSRFPGYTRALMVIEGSGLKLNQLLLNPLEPHYFSGDEVTLAELTLGQVRDLGLIYDAKQFTVKWDVIHLNPNQTLALDLTPSETQLFYALQGSGQVDGLKMHEGEVARTQGNRLLRLQASQNRMVWSRIRIEKTSC